MATLRELADGYLEAAARLRVGIECAQAELKQLDGQQRIAAQRQLALLERMLRDVREVGDLARHYYEPAYWRNKTYTV